MESLQRASITFPAKVDMVALLGPEDCNLRFIESRFPAVVSVRGNVVSFEGDEHVVRSLARLFSDMRVAVERNQVIDQLFLRHAIGLLQEPDLTSKDLREDVVTMFKGLVVRPKTAGQKRYVDAIRSNTITFGIGPAGTGKTYLAMASAVNALQKKEVARIVLTRPVVEAGENLGFLPGTLEEKVDPYIRPLYDALMDMSEPRKAHQLIEDGVIEIAPLAFMRGRTLNDSFIILDEAQNTTPEQMKMFLTRLGHGSKMVITGDASQGDLVFSKSGLYAIHDIIGEIDDIAFVDLSSGDVVRHSLVASVVAAYQEYAERL